MVIYLVTELPTDNRRLPCKAAGGNQLPTASLCHPLSQGE